MEESEYAVVAVIALTMVRIGVFTSSKPLSTYFVGETNQVTTVVMARITQWALVAGLTIVSCVNDWTLRLFNKDARAVQHGLPTPVLSAINEESRDRSSETASDGGFS